jgi:anaerobic selenocysteine-containing dehydrogenase
MIPLARSHDLKYTCGMEVGMVRDGIVSSVCSVCYAGCGVLIHLKDGVITKIEGNPEAPISKGVLCPKGLASLEIFTHPDRIKKPLRRAGKRGEGVWEEVTWDEALGLVAFELNKAKASHGAESVLFLRGAARGMQDNVFTRLVNAFGSPNITSMAFVCFMPRVNAQHLTFGSLLSPDYDHPPKCIVVWGMNPEATWAPIYRMITGALAKGAKLIVIDPRETTLTKRASLWIRPRPGSDLALAMAFLHVVIEEGLIDEEFVSSWTTGFDRLKDHVAEYTPERVEDRTWVPADLIRDAAILYAITKPGVVLAGNALEQTAHSFQTQRAISILEAITGNVGVPGGQIDWTHAPLVSRGSPEFTLQDLVPAEKRDRRHGGAELAPFAKYALPQAIVKALLENAPDRPRAAFIQGGNLFVTWPKTRATLSAFEKLDFVAMTDFFMTPTTQMADVLLPVASYLEHDGISHSPDFFWIAQVQQRVAEWGETWSDTKILIELGKKLGLQEHFWDDEYAFMNEVLKPAGITFEQFRAMGFIAGTKVYRHFEQEGFKTPSGKVELYSQRLAKWGFDPLPTYHESLDPVQSDGGVAREYPLVMTSWKPAHFRHSNLRQVEVLRRNRPDPLVDMNPRTAVQLGIEAGEWVYIETQWGRIEHKVRLSESVDPRLVIIEHGWWYPEKDLMTLHCLTDSNANMLTDNGEPRSREMGTPILRGLPCKVYKA